MSERTVSRPRMPSGYGMAQSQEGILPWQWAEERLVRARNYWLATASAAGALHVAPVWGLWLDDRLYFSTDPTSHKGRNLSAPRVAMHLENGDEAVILYGRARRLTAQVEIDRMVAAYSAKYPMPPDPANPAHGLYCLDPETVLAWTEAEFPRSAARWSFRT